MQFDFGPRRVKELNVMAARYLLSEWSGQLISSSDQDVTGSIEILLDHGQIDIPGRPPKKRRLVVPLREQRAL